MHSHKEKAPRRKRRGRAVTQTRRAGRARPRNVIFLLCLSSFSAFPFCQADIGGRRPVSPTRIGNPGLGQEKDIYKKPAVAAIEAYTRVLSRDNEVCIRWVPAHHGSLATRRPMSTRRPRPREESPTASSRSVQVGDQPVPHDASGHRSPSTDGGPVNCGVRRRPPVKVPTPPGKGLGRKLLRRTLKSVAGRYCQLLSGHTTIGPYLEDKIGKTTDDKCWWCGGGKQQTRHYLFTECRAWLPQIRKLWKDIGKAHGWKHPRTSVRWLYPVA